MMACVRGHLEVAELLLAHGADPTVETQDGHTAVLGACAAGQARVVELLSAKGVDLRSVNSLGYSPLMVASRAGHRDVVQVLLAATPKEKMGSENHFDS
jgi:ankyrin repeat protein